MLNVYFYILTDHNVPEQEKTIPKKKILLKFFWIQKQIKCLMLNLWDTLNMKKKNKKKNRQYPNI